MTASRHLAWRFHTRAEFESACHGSCGVIAPLGDGTALIRVLGTQLMLVNLADLNIAAHLMNDGYWESWISVAITRYVKPGMYVADVGANAGYYTLLMGPLVGPSGRVLACEPNPRLTPLIAKSISLNGLHWVRVFAGAVSNESGTVALHIPESGELNGTIVPCETPRSVTVPAKTLDELWGSDRLDFVKIDVEGAERLVWASMARLRENNPQLVILLEYNAARYSDPKAFLAEITREGFQLQYVNADANIVPVTADQLASENYGQDWMLWLSR